MKEGDRFEGYLLKNKLGEGGMAEVFRAERVGEHGVVREVCIKRIRPSFATDSAFVEMFVDEARIASTLRHGNIVAVEDFGRHEGVPFMVMTWVNGVDAATLLRRLHAQQQSMPIDATLHLLNCVLRGLEYAHGKRDANGQWLRIVHRDVSPQNILISFTGEVALTDFGIAKATSSMHQTERNLVKGKIAYMAPEQAASMPLDHRTDLFAVGVVAYQLLTGRLPFGDGSNLLDAVRALANGARDSVRSLRPEIPLEVEAFVNRLLELFPDARYSDAGIAREDLAKLPLLYTGERSLQRLVRACFGEDACSTITPRVPFALPAPSAVAPSASVHVALDATLPARPVERSVATSPGRPTRELRVRSHEIASTLATADTTPPPEPTGPFVAVSVVPPRRRSRTLLVSSIAGGCVVAVVSALLGARISSSTPHAATAVPTLPPGMTYTLSASGAPTLTIGRDAFARAGDAGRAAPPVGFGRVTVVAVPWGDISVDGDRSNFSPRTFLLPVGQHRASAMIRGRYIVSREFEIHEGENPNVTLGAPVVRPN